MAADERTTRELKRAAVLAHEYGVDFRIADLIARAELEREGKLVDALRFAYCQRGMSGCSCVSCRNVDKVLAAYESEFAPPKRTLAQVAADVVADAKTTKPLPRVAVTLELLNELAEALRREGGERG